MEIIGSSKFVNNLLASTVFAATAAWGLDSEAKKRAKKRIENGKIGQNAYQKMTKKDYHLEARTDCQKSIEYLVWYRNGKWILFNGGTCGFGLATG
jgi:hypothetical protein